MADRFDIKDNRGEGFASLDPAARRRYRRYIQVSSKLCGTVGAATLGAVGFILQTRAFNDTPTESLLFLVVGAALGFPIGALLRPIISLIINLWWVWLTILAFGGAAMLALRYLQ